MAGNKFPLTPGLPGLVHLLGSLDDLFRRIREHKRSLPQVMGAVDNSGDPDRPVEDTGFGVEYVGSDARNIVQPPPPPPRRNSLSLASLDASSRYLRDPSVNMVVVGLGVFSTRSDRPLAGPFTIPIDFFGISTYEEILKHLEKKLFPGVVTRNVENEYYDQDYHIDDLADELRLSAENRGLEYLLGDGTGYDVIIVDGPLYPTPLNLTDRYQAPKGSAEDKHRRAYAKLVRERVQLLSRRPEIIGVVKRIERAKKLGKVEEIQGVLGKGVAGMSDPDVLGLLLEKTGCRSPVCLVGPFKLSFKSSLVGTPPDRYAYYVALGHPLGRRAYYRVEATRLDVLEDNIDLVAYNYSEKLIPKFVEMADSLSKKVSRALYMLMYPLASRYLQIIYDDMLAYYELVKEGTEV